VTVAAPATGDDLDRPIRGALPELARHAAMLRRLGIETPRQALFYLPFRYDDFSELRTLDDLQPDEKQSARVRVEAVRVEKGFGRKPQRVIAQLSDATGSAEAVWFGRRYVETRLRPGLEIVISGKVSERGWRRQFTSPDFSPADHDSLHTARVVPVYPLSGGVSQKRLREVLAAILDRCLPLIADPLRPDERGGLLNLTDALRTVHFPEDEADVRPALDRLAFDELLALQLGLVQGRLARAALRAPVLGVAPDALAGIVEKLPFALTGDQRAAVDEIVADLALEQPMRRLLQGDVGSGKTAVAAVALAVAERAGRQGALMAPTEIQARQHHAGQAPLLAVLGVRAAFLSGSLPAAE
jgi:ATP-dependent DNA helicase RecG